MYIWIIIEGSTLLFRRTTIMSQEKFYQKTWFMYLFLVLIPPIGIIILWTLHKDFKNSKKILLSFLGLILLIMMISLNISDTQDSQEASNDKTSTKTENNTEKTPEADTPISIVPEYEADSPQSVLQDYILNTINDNYTYCDITELTINEDLGTDETNDYIALVYITWNQKNSGKMSREVLEMYSNDLAYRIAQDKKEIQEVCIFWTVPYLDNAQAKWSFERKNDGMYLTDNIFSPSSSFE